MCGIAGYFDPKSQVGNAALNQMVKALEHRGPDAQGSFSYKNFHLGHTRLSIIDLSEAANQPFTSSCGRYVIAFNGEVYNYKELRKTHQLNCRTASDTEVILELFIKYGPTHATLLNGMFAYCILDLKAEKLYLYRDRLG
ncbi:MAG TPA: hypothetical protein VL947_01970, partial [Cytophagales bacterium]|nr:hypothetical protein [Cytophagales bacterium]